MWVQDQMKPAIVVLFAIAACPRLQSLSRRSRSVGSAAVDEAVCVSRLCKEAEGCHWPPNYVPLDWLSLCTSSRR